jgi:hypothetical protein
MEIPEIILAHLCACSRQLLLIDNSNLCALHSTLAGHVHVRLVVLSE